MGISKTIKEDLNRSSWVRKMFEEGEYLKKKFGKENVYDFTLGNPFGEPPIEFRNELIKCMNDLAPGKHAYMPNVGYNEIREKIAEELKEEYGLPFTLNQVIMSCGAAGGINVVLKTLIEPGDEVIVFVPYFMEYAFYIKNHSGLVVEVPTKKNFKLDINALDKAIGVKTRAVILNSPNNPTGVVYNEEVLKEFSELMKVKEKEIGRPIYIISDEAYRRLVYDDIKLPNIFRIIENCIMVTSHSKDLSIPGERIGFIVIGPYVEDKEDIFNGLSFSTRVLGFVNAPALMQKVVANLQKVTVDITLYQKKRDVFYENLNSLGYEVIKPSGAFYLFPHSPNGDDVAFVREAKEKKILIVPGRGFGISGYFRISYGVEERVIFNALNGFEELAKKYNLI